jgi:hypothetical protein
MMALSCTVSFATQDCPVGVIRQKSRFIGDAKAMSEWGCGICGEVLRPPSTRLPILASVNFRARLLFFATSLYGRVVLPATLLDMVEYERKLDSASKPTRAPIHTKYKEKKQHENTC